MSRCDSSKAEDPQGTNIPSLLRYALGLALTDDPSQRAPPFAGSAAEPAIRFPFDFGRYNIAYVVEVTSDMADWASRTILFDSRTDFPPTSHSDWITVNDSAGSGAQRFIACRFS